MGYPDTVTKAATKYESWNAIDRVLTRVNRRLGYDIITPSADEHIIFEQLSQAKQELQNHWQRVTMWPRPHDDLHRVLWLIAAVTHSQQLAMHDPIVQEELNIKPSKDGLSVPELISAIYRDEAIAVEGWRMIEGRRVAVAVPNSGSEQYTESFVGKVVGMRHAQLVVRDMGNATWNVDPCAIIAISDASMWGADRFSSTYKKQLHR